MQTAIASAIVSRILGRPTAITHSIVMSGARLIGSLVPVSGEGVAIILVVLVPIPEHDKPTQWRKTKTSWLVKLT